VAPAAPAAAALALALAVADGWGFAAAGFPILLLDLARQWLRWGLLTGGAGALLFAVLHPPLARRLPGTLALAVAGAVAAAPAVGAGGYLLNRRLGVRPAELLESYAGARNLLYLAACGVALGLALAGARRALRRGDPGARRAAWWVAAGLAPLVAVEAAGGLLVATAPPKDRPDVLVLLVDALRADHLGAYGHRRPTTPALDGLARDSVLFEQAIAQSTFTKTSVASLFTGLFPYRHGVYWGGNRENPETVTSDVLPQRLTTLAEVLGAHGYLTAAWVQNSHLRRFMGFAQGFVAWHDQQGPIERINRRVGRFAVGPGRRHPYFAYVHYIDLHDPYRPRPPYDALFGDTGGVYDGVDFAAWGAYLDDLRAGRRRLTPGQVERLGALYDGQLRHVDEQIGRLLAELRGAGLYERSLIVLTSDHGEAFMEHGFISHSAAPYDELLRVPLLVKLPGGRFAGARVGEQVRLVDLFPTLLEAVGVTGAPAVDGCSLLPLVRGGASTSTAARPDSCSVAVAEIAEDGDSWTLAVRTQRFKLIRGAGGRDELYDLVEDPGERIDLAGEGRPEEAALARLADSIAAERATTASETIELDSQLIRELKALGYLE
jgi:arylsulfatase A-like enzyme